MLSIFRSRKKKNPKKGLTFYNRENILQTIDELNNLLKKAVENTDAKSEELITFHGKQLKNITLESITEDFGQEEIILTPENDIEGNTVYYFRLTSEHLKFLIQIHFIDDKFLLAATKVYGDVPLTDSDKQKINKRIIDKYFPGSKDNNLINSFKDSEGNVLISRDDVFYYLIYLANNDLTIKLREKYKNYKPAKAGDELKSTLDELI